MTHLLQATTDEVLGEAAQFLREGGLVSFPTETVYGLGAHAGSSASIRRIFEVKGRPSTDPLIVHLGSPEMAELLINRENVNQWQTDALRCLTREFWPGPLTIILPANPKEIVPEVTSETGWVGLRYPAHPVAQRFLRLCDVPVAAPSANLFGHVSPTSAEHVSIDFPHVDNMWIVDGGRCGFGIESTVLRINSNQTLDIFRRGGVGHSQLTQALIREGLIRSNQQSHVTVIERYESLKAKMAQPAPGQLLTHYAPKIPARLISVSREFDHDFIERESSELKNIVVLDFAGKLKALKSLVGHYRDLSVEGDARQAAYALFDDLRWAETQVSGNGQLWISDPRCQETPADELFFALQDRIIRAASGQSSQVCIRRDSDRVYVLIR